jgi:hypothetical protein
VTAEAPALPSTAVGHADPHAAAVGHAQRGISNPILGMILFITSEVMNSSIPRIGLLIPRWA